MEPALDCTVFSAAAGSRPDLVTFSISVSNAAATCSQVAVAGGAFASSSCLPNTASFGSAVNAGSDQALFTDGRSVDRAKNLTWVLGSESHWTNFQALSRFLLFLNTARSEPPTNEVAVFCLGIIMTPYLSLKPALPSSLRPLISHGPEMNIGTDPLTKLGAREFCGSCLAAILSVK